MNLGSELSKTILSLKQRRPLILNITNHVAMEFSANALLALGASPIMTLEIREMDELVRASDAIVINMGTLNEEWLQNAERAWTIAASLKKPVVFDPVGAGATRYRTEVARNLLEKYGSCIVRGNASEILSILANERTTKGVDSTLSADAVVEKARERAVASGVTFVISGNTDYIVDSQIVYWVKNGDPRMTGVTAMGCVSTCIVAAFRALESDPPTAALQGMSLVGLCGEMAAEESRGPGSLRTAFLDNLANDDLPLMTRLKIGVL